MICEEFQHGGLDSAIAQAVAELVGRETGQRQQAFGAFFIGQRPAERLQRQHFGLSFVSACRFLRIENCQSFRMSLGLRSHFTGVPGPVAKRILVVEDNDLNRKLFCDVLKANGYEVVPVSDGNNFLATAKRSDPQLVIMDIQLPNVSGVDLITQLKADSAMESVPVLAVTAYAGKGDEERIRDAGAEDYLAKPVSIGPFMAAVRKLLSD